MEVYEDFKKEIHNSLLNQAKDNTGVTWNAFINDMRIIILSTSKNISPADHRLKWRQAFKIAIQKLSLALCNTRTDDWDSLFETRANEEASSSNSSSHINSEAASISSTTTSISYQKKLSQADYLKISENYEKITKKWILKSGRAAEEIIFDISKNFIVEHPAHSYILNLKDPVWKDVFSEDEAKEIKTKEKVFSFQKPFPPELQEVILTLNRKVNFREIYDAIDSIKAHPIDNPQKFWLKQSILNFTMLFCDSNVLTASETEQDLLDDNFGFIKKSCRLSKTRAIGAKQSESSSESKNSNRAIGSLCELQRKCSAEKPDLTFKFLSHELLCLEIGLKDNGPTDTKEMNESFIKTPLMMKNFCSRLMYHYKMKPDNIKILGITISGLHITGLGMSFNHGSISLLSSSDRLRLPESVSEIPRLLPPVLNLIYNLNMSVKSTVEELEMSNSVVVTEPENNFFFPPTFVPAVASSHKKRKSKETA